MTGPTGPTGPPEPGDRPALPLFSLGSPGSPLPTDVAGGAPIADASVSRATPGDAAAIGIVQDAVWAEAFLGLIPSAALAAGSPAAFAQAWEASLAAPPSPRHVALVARAGDRVVGFAALAPNDDPDAGGDAPTHDLLVLGVHPRDRGAGHGSRLLNACVDVAGELGAWRVSAWVPDALRGTRAFLSAAGFAADGARRDRVVSADGDTLSEARLVVATRLAPEPPA